MRTMTIFEDEFLEMCFRSIQLRCFANKDLSRIKVVRWSTSLGRYEGRYFDEYEEIHIDRDQYNDRNELVDTMIHELMHYVYRRTKHCKKWRKLEHLYNELHRCIDDKAYRKSMKRKIKCIERNFRPTW